MCMSTPPPFNPQPSQFPSVQAATNLQIGGSGAPRGAAQLGRLALRFGGGTSTPAAAAPPTQAATPTGPRDPAAPVNASEAQVPGVGTAPGSLAGLRFGNYTGAFA